MAVFKTIKIGHGILDFAILFFSIDYHSHCNQNLNCKGHPVQRISFLWATWTTVFVISGKTGFAIFPVFSVQPFLSAMSLTKTQDRHKQRQGLNQKVCSGFIKQATTAFEVGLQSFSQSVLFENSTVIRMVQMLVTFTSVTDNFVIFLFVFSASSIHTAISFNVIQSFVLKLFHSSLHEHHPAPPPFLSVLYFLHLCAGF